MVLLLGVADERADRLGQRFVRAEHEVQFAIEHERQLVAHQPQRRVGGQRAACSPAAGSACGCCPRCVRARARPSRPAGAGARGCAGCPASGRTPAHQHHRAIEAVVLAPARREVGDLDRAAVAVVQHRAQHRGVGEVVLLGAAKSSSSIAQSPPSMLAADSSAQNAGSPSNAGRQPHTTRAARIDQRAEAAVADEAEVEVGRSAHAHALRRGSRWRARARRAPPPGSRSA